MKFNKQAKDFSDQKTTNLAGGKAYTQNPKLELVSHLLTSFVEDKFYQSAEDQLARLRELLELTPKEFAAKAAIYARNEFGMRSISHVVAGELCQKVARESWMKDFLSSVIRRPDDICEITAYYKSIQTDKTQFKVTNAMKKGLGAALSKFDKYQLAKYQGKTRNIKLVDCVRLYHPKSTPAIKALVYDRLKNKDTWEAKVSAAGSNKAKKAEAWSDMVTSGKIGYFALLRNLRNIAESNPELLPKCREILTDDRKIKKSLVMPFRYLSALEATEPLSNRSLMVMLAEAMEKSLSNVPKFDGKTLVVLDSSSSMLSAPGTWGQRRSEFNAKVPANIGTVFASALYKANDADFMLFDSDARYHTMMPTDSMISLSRQIRQQINGGSTNFLSVFNRANKAYDRIIILSDMQGWKHINMQRNFNVRTCCAAHEQEDMRKASTIGGDTDSMFNRYKKKFKCNPFLYSFDLAGHGSLQVPEKKTFCVAGFSEKVFDVMKLLEQDRNALVNEIEKVSFTNH